MDVWVAIAPENLDRLRAALQRFGFSPGSLPGPLFQPPRTVLRFGLPPNRIEVLSEISGVMFSECYARRLTIEVEGLPVAVISRDDLLANKRASARPQDLADVDRITKADRRHRGTAPP
jgi:hypothetical protein